MKRFLLLTLFLSLIVGFYSCKIPTFNWEKESNINFLASYTSKNIDLEVPSNVINYVKEFITFYDEDYHNRVPNYYKSLAEEKILAREEGLTYLDYKLSKEGCTREDLENGFIYPYGRNEKFNSIKYANYYCKLILLNGEQLKLFIEDTQNEKDLWHTMDYNITYDIFPNTKVLENGKYIIDDTRGNMLIEIDDVSEFYVSEDTTYICSHIWKDKENLQFNEYEGCLYLPSKTNPYYAFLEPIDKTLTEYKIHKDTKVIADYAFGECSNIETVTFEDLNTCVGIGNYAFINCTNLKRCNFPSSIDTINSSILDMIPNIELYNDGIANYLGNDENPYLMLCNITNKEIEEFNFYESTKIILENGLIGCPSKEKLEIPNNITQISAYSIGYYSNIEIGDGIKLIENNPFRCKNLVIKGRNIIFERASKYVNYRSEHLKTENIYFDGTVNDWVQNKFEGSVFSEYYNEKCSKLYTLENSTYTLVENPQISCNVSDYAFANYKYLTEVTFKNGVKSIGKYAFYNTSCKKIEFANTIEKVKINAFLYAKNISQFTYVGTIDEYCKIEYDTPCSNPIFYSTTLALKEGTKEKNIKELIIGDDVTKINDYAFINLVSVKKIVIGKNVKEIGREVFVFSVENLETYVLGNVDMIKYGGLVGYVYFTSSDVSNKYEDGWRSHVSEVTWDYKE